MKRLLYWFCVMVVALPMMARLIPSERSFSPWSLLVVGDSECAIPIRPVTASCTVFPWRPVILSTGNDSALMLMDVLALGLLLAAMWRLASRQRFAAPTAFAGFSVVLAEIVAAIFLLDFLNFLGWTAAALLEIEINQMISLATRGRWSVGDLRMAATVLWFWVAFGPPLFGKLGEGIERASRAAVREAANAATAFVFPSTRVAGAFGAWAVCLGGFAVASLIGRQQDYDLWFPVFDAMLMVVIAVLLALTARGLALRKIWARRSAIALGLVSLTAGPVGIFVGVFALWQLAVVNSQTKGSVGAGPDLTEIVERAS